MIPTYQSWPLFVALLLPSQMLGVVIHELGHLAAGRLARVDVVACGVGLRRPWLWRTWRGVTFYLGWPLTSGLTLFVSEGICMPRRAFLCCIVGGPAATLLICAVAWVAWLYGAHWDWIAAVFWTALFTLLVTGIPAQVASHRITLLNDAALAWHTWKGRDVNAMITPGASLASMSHLADFCGRIGCLRGRIAYTLGLAGQQADLGHWEEAVKTLQDESLGDPRRMGWGSDVERVVRACAMAGVDETLLEDALNDLEQNPVNHPDLQVPVTLLRLDAALSREQPVADIARAALQTARSARIDFLEHYTQALVLVAEAPEDLGAQVQAMIGPRNFGKITPLGQLSLCTETCRILAERGEIESAREWFATALAQHAEIADSIADIALRERFIALTSRRLRRAIDATPETAGLFVPTAGTIDVGSDKQCARLLLYPIMVAFLLVVTLFAFVDQRQRVLQVAAPTAWTAALLGLLWVLQRIVRGSKQRQSIATLGILYLILFAGTSTIVMQQIVDANERARKKAPSTSYDRPVADSPVGTTDD